MSSQPRGTEANFLGRMFALRPVRYTFLVISILVLFLAGARQARRPVGNWDLLPYIALTMDSSLQGEALHRATYASVKRHIRPTKFLELTIASPYRRRMASDSAAFVKQLDFYRFRVLYITAIRLLPGNSVRRAVLVSTLGWFLAALATLIFMIRRFSVVTACATTLALFLSPPILATADLVTPDAPAAFFLLAGVFAFMNLRLASSPLAQVAEPATAAIAALSLFCAIAMRPAFLSLICIFMIVYAGPGLFRGYWKRSLFALGIIVGAVFLYAFLSGGFGHPGWAAVIHHTFVERLMDPSTFRGDVSWRTYVDVFRNGLNTWPVAGSLIVVSCALIGPGVRLVRYIRRPRDDNGIAEDADPAFFLWALQGAILFDIALRFFVFPVMWSRFFVPHMVLLVIVSWEIRKPSLVEPRSL